MSEILSYLRELNIVSLTLRFLLAALFGGLIGFGRGKNRHAAGLRTHLLVCIGAACVMMVNQYVCGLTGSGDMARMGAQVISGIGFLGAGTIIVTGRNQITGLTTAAGLWASACMGLAVGIGYYECAAVMCLLLYFVLMTLNRLDGTRLKAKSVTVYVELNGDAPMSELLKVVSGGTFMTESIDQFPPSGGKSAFIFHLSARGAGDSAEALLQRIQASPAVYFADVI